MAKRLTLALHGRTGRFQINDDNNNNNNHREDIGGKQVIPGGDKLFMAGNK